MRYAEEEVKAPRDFIPRRRLPTILQFCLVFLGFFLLMIGVWSVTYSLLGFGVFSLIIIAGVAYGVMISVQRARDMVLATEYQNAIYASALSLESDFSLIIRPDGSITYFDQGTQQVFPHFSRLKHPTIYELLEAGRVSQQEMTTITQTISEFTPQKLVFSIYNAENEAQPMVLTLDPITRPGKFILIRARKFIINRFGEQAAPEMAEVPHTPVADLPTPVVQVASNANLSSLEQLIAHSPIPVAHIASDGYILSLNEAFHTMTQHALTRELSARLVDLVSAEKKPDAEALFARLAQGEVPIEPQLLDLLLPNQQQVTVSVYISRIASAHEVGVPPEYLLYLIDVTEQKNLELRFSHSQKMQAVGQLAGGVAHDFNNLLTAMIGFCDLLLMRHPAGDQSFADIMQIKQNANRAANLVRQLLAFSRRQTLQPKSLDITDVLAELSNLVRRLIGENIELKMIHGRDLGTVKADQGQLEQVMINLAVNARDAMSKGGTLTIRTSRAHIASRASLPANVVVPADEDNNIPSGEYVLVEVTDTGCGIPRHIMQKIFEPFFSTKEVGSGTGLGLSTVYGIIKQTGGYIYVTSREGMGSTFYIYFPLHQSKGIAAPTEVESSDKNLTDLTGRATVLLVEDETPVRIFSARALRNKGYTVLEADCGEAGLDLMQEKGAEVELIITDVIMPGMNGPTMVEKIHEQYPNVKVIFISGYAEDVFMHSYGSERSFNFLAKPFTLKQLATKVKEVLISKA